MAKKLQKSDLFSPIFNRLIDLCEDNKTTVTTLLDKFANSRSAINAWKNGNIATNILPNIANELNVSLDILLTGKEKSLPKLELTPNEQELLDNFNKLSDISKGKLLEKAENLVELETKEKAEKENKPHIETVFMAARSSDHHPPEIVTGDFSDILNAPDATDEY